MAATAHPQANSSDRRCVVHLDLKGLPPGPFDSRHGQDSNASADVTPPDSGRLLELPAIFAACGYNAILVEWEDAFPWTVDTRFRSQTCYSPRTVRAFVEQAGRFGLEIIPLVQCLGHMETILRLDDYAHLREQADRVDCLNPLADGACELVDALIEDVLELMPDVQHFHLGGDEAWAFATHPDTKAYAEQYGKDQLYLSHVQPLLDKLCSRGIRPLLWHDMMIDWNESLLRTLSDKADLVVWGYAGHPDHVDNFYGTRYVERFHKIGVPMWVAGAYKGADGQSRDRHILERRLENARAWMDLDARFGFRGVIATAWSRYSTHRVQNEPIDGNLDALVLVGQVLSGNTTATSHEKAVKDVLAPLGEYDRFVRCRDVLEQLQTHRDNMWLRLQETYENIAVAHVDPCRRDNALLQQQVSLCRESLAQLEQTAEQFTRVFAGLVPDAWIREYVYVRLEPVRTLLESAST